MTINSYCYSNNDTVVDPLFLTHMLEKINIEQRIEMIAAQMIKYDNRSIIDNLGITFYKSGLASNRRSVDDPLLSSLRRLRPIHHRPASPSLSRNW